MPKMKVIRKPGDRYHPDCVQKTYKASKTKNKVEKRYHVWAAIGYGSKSELVFYESSSSNGKMTLKVYKE
jgi:hypothetical protein